MEKTSNNHPDQDSASELACFDVSSLEEAKRLVRINKIVMDSGGMMQAERALRIVGHQTSRIILNGSFYGHEFVHPDLSAGTGKRFTRSLMEKRNVTPPSASISRTLPATRE